MDGAQNFDGGSGMSASAHRANARQAPERAANQSKYAQKFSEMATAFSSDEILTINWRKCGGCADLPCKRT
jgi:hypothetical protein